MLRVATNEFKNGLSHFLDQVAAGEEILITRHGEVVARLVPENHSSAERRRIEAFERMAEIRETLRENGDALPLSEILSLRDVGHRS